MSSRRDLSTSVSEAGPSKSESMNGVAEAIREHNRRVSVGGAVVKLVRSMTQNSTQALLEKQGSQPQMTKREKENVLLRTFKKQPEFYAERPVQEVLDELRCNAHTGLAEVDVPSRIERYGLNELQKPPPRLWYHMLADQFKDPLIIILLVSSVFAIAAGGVTEGVVILAIVVLNAGIGVQQEGKSEDAIAKLQEITEDTCVVRRDGEPKVIDKRQLVPGDIVILRVGSKVPADGRVIKGGNNFRVMEAMLTGESKPVRKVAHGRGGFTDEETSKPEAANGVAAGNSSDNDAPVDEEEEKATFGRPAATDTGKVETSNTMLYMGTEVLTGAGEMVVVRTGMSTKMGDITGLLAQAESKESPLQEKLGDLGEKLGIYGIAVCSIVLVVGITTERGTDPQSEQAVWLQMVLITVSLIVAFVPEGLPVVTAITLATGMGQMAKRNCIIKNLKSVETMGNASVICSDKTGTLTTGIQKMERMLIVGEGGGKLVRYQLTGEGYSTKGEVMAVDADDSKSNGADSPGLQRALSVVGLCNQATVTENKDANNRPVYEATGNLTDRACAVAAIIGGVLKDQNRVKTLQVNEHDSTRKMMSAVVEYTYKDGLWPVGTNLALVKGAPNVMLPRCTHCWQNGERVPMDKETAKLITNTIDNLSDQAYRVLLMAVAPLQDVKGPNAMEPEVVEASLDFVGLGAIIDPEREGVKEAIQTAAQAHVRTMMITGDYYKTAVAIANRLGLLEKRTDEERELTDGDMAVDASELDKLFESAKKQVSEVDTIPFRTAKTNVDDLGGQIRDLTVKIQDNGTEQLKSQLNLLKGSMREAEKELKQASIKHAGKVRELYINELTRMAQKLRVVARAQPRHKLDLVEALQQTGDTVSMTGDGVNDAPALKQADIGLAMGITGTDVAKAAADAIITDDNFVTIVEAIKEGRRIYSNIGKFVYFLLSTNVAEVFVITIAAISGMVSPLRPTQILWLNLMTDSSPALALAMDDFDPMLMHQPPRNRNSSLIDRQMMVSIVIHTVILTAVCLATYAVGLNWHTCTWTGSEDVFCNGATDDESKELGIKRAQTMEIYVIVFAELLRAYTSRDLIRHSWSSGLLSNNWLQLSVIVSIGITVLVGTIPALQDIFGMAGLDNRSVVWVVCFSLVPVILDELIKWIMRCMGAFGYKDVNVDN